MLRPAWPAPLTTSRPYTVCVVYWAIGSLATHAQMRGSRS